MLKYIALMISTLCFPFSIALANELPDFCNTGEYICHEVRPNYVVAYPASLEATKNDNKSKRNSSHSRNESNASMKDMIEVDLTNLTWTAYDSEGILLRSGRVSGGKDYCADIDDDCQTVTGTFEIYRKGDESCKSTKFPIGRGGAPMPYCMFFHGGYALHGSNSVPNYNASHGCVRMSPEDAQWLNEDFVEVGSTHVTIHY